MSFGWAVCCTHLAQVHSASLQSYASGLPSEGNGLGIWALPRCRKSESSSHSSWDSDGASEEGAVLTGGLRRELWWARPGARGGLPTLRPDGEGWPEPRQLPSGLPLTSHLCQKTYSTRGPLRAHYKTCTSASCTMQGPRLQHHVLICPQPEQTQPEPQPAQKPSPPPSHLQQDGRCDWLEWALVRIQE